MSSGESPAGISADPHVGIAEYQREGFTVVPSLLRRLSENDGNVLEAPRREHAKIERIQGHALSERIEPRLLSYRLGDPPCCGDQEVLTKECRGGV